MTKPKANDKLPDPAAEAEARDLVEHPHDPYTTAPVVDLTRPLYEAVTYEPQNIEHAGHGSALVLESTGEGELAELERLEQIELLDPITFHLVPGTYVIKFSPEQDADGRARLMIRHSPPGGQSSFDEPALDVMTSPDGIAPRLVIPNARYTSEKET